MACSQSATGSTMQCQASPHALPMQRRWQCHCMPHIQAVQVKQIRRVTLSAVVSMVLGHHRTMSHKMPNLNVKQSLTLLSFDPSAALATDEHCPCKLPKFHVYKQKHYSMHVYITARMYTCKSAFLEEKEGGGGGGGPGAGICDLDISEARIGHQLYGGCTQAL